MTLCITQYEPISLESFHSPTAQGIITNTFFFAPTCTAKPTRPARGAEKGGSIGTARTSSTRTSSQYQKSMPFRALLLTVLLTLLGTENSRICDEPPPVSYGPLVVCVYVISSPPCARLLPEGSRLTSYPYLCICIARYRTCRRAQALTSICG
jgi:hypothetical protein